MQCRETNDWTNTHVYNQDYKLPFSVFSALGASSHNFSVSQDREPGKGPPPILHTGPSEFAAVTWLESSSTPSPALIRMAMKRESELTRGERLHLTVRLTVSYSVNWNESLPLIVISCPPFASLKKLVSDVHEFWPFVDVRVGHYCCKRRRNWLVWVFSVCSVLVVKRWEVVLDRDRAILPCDIS